MPLYTRDMVGYGNTPPDITWPNGARLAINFIINYEEGAELSPLNEDDFAETYGNEINLTGKAKGERNLSSESLFEYGSRVGIWRLTKLFDEYRIPLTFFTTGLALKLNPKFALYLKNSQHEVAGHGWRWLDYSKVAREVEAEHIQKCIMTLESLTDKEIKGWYTGRKSIHTRELLIDDTDILYDSDSYADDLPYYVNNHLVIPYSLLCNDFRFVTSPGFSSPQDFFNQLKYTFDFLINEQKLNIMSIGLHPRISGYPARMRALQKFFQYIENSDLFWITRRIDIADFWRGQINP